MINYLIDFYKYKSWATKSMTTEIIILLVITVLFIGFIRTAKQLLTVARSLLFTRRFYNVFQEYYNSNGGDKNQYRWLIENSEYMQKIMGTAGVLAIYRAPLTNQAFTNYPLIINLLPALDQDFDMGFSYHTTEPVAHIIDSNLLRFIGILKTWRGDDLITLFNPVALFRQGIQTIFVSPIFILEYIGLISEASAERATTNRLFNISTRIISLILGVFSVIGFIVNWQPFTEIVKRVLHLSS